jgi:hypothetical protein
MFAEELRVFFARVKVMRCQYSGQDRRARFQLHLHQAVDDSLRHEFVPVDTAIDHETRGNNSRVAATLSEQLRVQRDFEGAGDFVEIDVIAAESLCLDGTEERRFALVDNVAMPARLNERDARTRLGGRANGGITFESSCERHKCKPVCVNRAKEGMFPLTQMLSRERTHAIPFSFIRTMTVGPGIKPGLLTFVFRHASEKIQGKTQSARGLRAETVRDYRRWGVSPRPENSFLVNGT